jgi:non-heme chloroperoxidase
MAYAANATSLDTGVSGKTLMAYARAVRDFTKAPFPKLPGASFDLITAIDMTELPRAQTFCAADGAHVGFRFYRAATSPRVLVLIHGAAGFGDQFHGMASRLAHNDLASVYTLNMRGHGLSGGERGHAVDYPGQLVDDVREFVAHLRIAMPEARIVLGGHSAGGGLALAVARTATDADLSGYVFLAPFLGLGSRVNKPHFGGWMKLRGSVVRAVMWANALGIRRFNQSTVAEFSVGASGGDPRYVPTWSYNTLLAFGPGRWAKDAPPIATDKPVLLMAGADDDCFVQPLYREAFSAIAPHAEMPELRGGHWDVMVSTAAVAALGEWLADQSLAELVGFVGRSEANAHESGPHALKEAS